MKGEGIPDTEYILKDLGGKWGTKKNQVSGTLSNMDLPKNKGNRRTGKKKWGKTECHGKDRIVCMVVCLSTL